MELRLPPDLEAIVRRKVASGQYRDELDVLTDALSLLETEDDTNRAAVLQAIDEGDADLAAGRSFTFDTAEQLEKHLRST